MLNLTHNQMVLQFLSNRSVDSRALRVIKGISSYYLLKQLHHEQKQINSKF
jgi:hypothetical protein